MEAVLSTITIITLFILFLQDLKYRAFSWILFPVLVVAGSLNRVLHQSIHNWLYDLMANLLFICLSACLVFTWLVFIKKHAISRLPDLIGLGDLLFVLFMMLSIPFPIFPFLLIVSLIVALLTALLFYQSGELIPLAGLQAAVLIPYFVFDHFHLPIISGNLY